MRKASKLLAIALAAVMALGFTGCGGSGSDGEIKAVPKDKIKVGVIHIGNPADGAGYSYAHDQGIQQMKTKLGLRDDQIINKINIPDEDVAKTRTAIEECIEEGCNIIFGTSFNYMNTMEELAKDHPSIIFSHGTGYKNNGVNLNNYRTIMSRLGRNIRNTYVFSIVAIVFIIFIGILVSYVLVRKKGKIASLIDTLIMFPYVIPGSVLGIGLIVAFNRKPLILVGTAAIMIISYVIRKLPYTVRSGSAFLYQMDPFVEEASINLGVSPMKTFFTVTARMMLPGIMSGAVLSWITCINELSSSIMLYSGKTSTIAVAIYQEVVRMSDGTAAALATILTLTTIVSLVIVFRATKGQVKIV